MQDADVPMEDTAGVEPFAPCPIEEGGPSGVEDNAPAEAGEFPAMDDAPFDGAGDGDAPLQDAPPGESPTQDGLSPGGDEGDMPTDPSGADTEGGEADFTAFLAEMGQGGMEPVLLPDDDNGGGAYEGEGNGQDSSPGDVPPMSRRACSTIRPHRKLLGRMDPAPGMTPLPPGPSTAAPPPVGPGSAC